MNCKKCGVLTIRTSNSQKYCAVCRAEATKYTEYRSTWQRNRNDARATRDITGKIPCVICGKYYTKPIAHAWQRHGTDEREYKQYAGLDHKKGIIPEEAREVLRKYVRANYAKVVTKNLLTNGKKSRYKRGDPNIGKYTRSAQTIARLKNRTKKYDN